MSTASTFIYRWISTLYLRCLSGHLCREMLENHSSVIRIPAALIYLGMIAIPLIAVSPTLRENMAEARARRDQLLKQEQAMMDSESQAKLAAQQSQLALLRIAGPCIPAINATTRTPVRMTEGARFVLTGEAFALSEEEYTLEDGVCVANHFGDTAILADGKLSDIARASGEDIGQFQVRFAQQPDAYPFEFAEELRDD